MKQTLKRRICAAILCHILLLGLAGCGKANKAKPNDGGDSPVKASADALKQGQPAADSEETVDGAESLARVRGDLEYDGRLTGAAAYLGLREKGDQTELTDWLRENCADLTSELPFLLEIPSERVLGAGYGKLFCIVPRDENTSLAVNHVTWQMMGNGLREVSNPSEMLLGDYAGDLSGVAIAAAMEGARPFLIETQALVSTAAYGTPQRNAMGYDVRRMNMLLAVLERRAGFKIAAKDVFLNLAGGIKVSDTALDLPIAAAVLSSSTDMAIARGTCMAGEIGLSGELRPVARTEQRVAEARKLGFNRIIIAEGSRLMQVATDGIEICRVSRLSDAFRLLFQ